MKRMRKITLCMLALVLVIGMPAVALAAEDTSGDDLELAAVAEQELTAAAEDGTEDDAPVAADADIPANAGEAEEPVSSTTPSGNPSTGANTTLLTVSLALMGASLAGATALAMSFKRKKAE